MNCLVTSDLHIHSHKNSVSRLQDCLDALNWIFDVAIDNKCPYILFLGDLFHERAKIDVLVYLRTFEVFMKRLAGANLQVKLLSGNHDMYYKESWDVTSIKPLSAIKGVQIIDSPITDIINGVCIDWMPYTDNPIKELKELKDSKSKLLLGHMAVDGAKLNKIFGTKSDVIVEYDNDMCVVDTKVFDKWDMTILGHYHGAQKLNDKVEYIGSPLQLSFGEADEEKHVMVLDLKTFEKTYIINSFSPKHIITTADKLIYHDLNNNFVRLLVDDISSTDISDIKSRLSKVVASLDFKQEDKKQKLDLAAIDDAKTLALKREDLLEEYVEKVGVPAGLDKSKLLNIGKNLCVTN